MPQVSVILPVYNGAAFLREAIDSILAQTFTDFELLIINDGSTDESEKIILSYKDERIKYFKNNGNKGLVFTLNRAIAAASGEYIARMDADDIAMPERLVEQMTWLKNNPLTAVVASFSDEIDDEGKGLGFYIPDRKTITAQQIRRKMPVHNCLTHPTVMGRADVFKFYKYSFAQPNIEDYDLWLRLLGDGKIIEKIPKVLLLYRVHQTSVTQTKLRQKNFFFKHFLCKKRFLANRIKGGKFNSFDLQVSVQMFADLVKGLSKSAKGALVKKMKYRLFLFKRQIEDILMFPLILLGRLIAMFRPLHREYETFFFFPFYHIGGAEKVHYNIAKAIGGRDCIIFFTRKSLNNLFYREFAASGCEMRDISKYTDNKWLYFVNIVYRGIITGYINRQKNAPLIFNGQCNFGYKVSPWVAKKIPQVELIHSLCSFSYIRIPFLPFIIRTVMISTIRIKEHLDLYKRYGIPLKFGEKITFIMNAIDLPAERPSPQKTISKLNALYVGRSTPEKRVYLIAKIASLLKNKNENIQFTFLGEVKDAIPKEHHSYCIFLGNQSDPKVIDEVYRSAHVLILVSDTEGFPMVVMEAMAYGLAIVTTSVGELSLHIKSDINGFLIDDYKNENVVMREAIEAIMHLFDDKKLLQDISENNIRYACKHFGIKRFEDDYKRLANEVRGDRPAT